MLAADKQKPSRLIPELSFPFVSQQFESPCSFLGVGQRVTIISIGKIKVGTDQRASSITADALAVSSSGTPQ